MNNPYIEVRSSNGIREISLETNLLSNRVLFLTGEINEEVADTFMAEFLYLEQTDGPITVYVHSRGGEVNSGLMIYDVLQGSKKEINIVCAGIAASMAAIIVASGQKGHRYILPHGKIMIHEPLIGGGVGGSATSIKNISESILKTRAITNGILAKHTGKSLKEIDEATAFDNYMDPDEAIEFGLIDSILEGVAAPTTASI